MRTVENYTRQYLYDPGDMKTGLYFETDHPDGFVYGCQHWKEKREESEDQIKTILEHAEVQFGFASEEAIEYILQELRLILKNRPSLWRINHVEPRPNQISLKLVLKDEDADSPNRNLIDELLKNACQVTIDICGDDIQEKNRILVKLELKCRDTYDPDDVSYLSIHAFHNSRAECAWEKERVHINLEQTRNGRCYYERSVFARWKNKKREKMIAEIEETY